MKNRVNIHCVLLTVVVIVEAHARAFTGAEEAVSPSPDPIEEAMQRGGEAPLGESPEEQTQDAENTEAENPSFTPLNKREISLGLGAGVGTVGTLGFGAAFAHAKKRNKGLIEENDTLHSEAKRVRGQLLTEEEKGTALEKQLALEAQDWKKRLDAVSSEAKETFAQKAKLEEQLDALAQEKTQSADALQALTHKLQEADAEKAKMQAALEDVKRQHASLLTESEVLKNAKAQEAEKAERARQHLKDAQDALKEGAQDIQQRAQSVSEQLQKNAQAMKAMKENGKTTKADRDALAVMEKQQENLYKNMQIIRRDFDQHRSNPLLKIVDDELSQKTGGAQRAVFDAHESLTSVAQLLEEANALPIATKVAGWFHA